MNGHWKFMTSNIAAGRRRTSFRDPLATPSGHAKSTIYCTSCLRHVSGPWCAKHPDIQPKFSSPHLSLPESHKVRWGVLDLETENLADEVGGWDHIRKDGNWHKLGLTVAGVWDSATEHITPYEREDAHELADHLESFDVLCTYNGTRFDIPVVEAIAKRPLHLQRHFDVLRILWDAGSTKNKLGEVVGRTLGLSKLGEGSSAPQLARDGHWVKLIRYCHWDIYCTRMLVQHVVKEKWIIDHNGDKIPVELPTWLPLEF